MITHTAHANPKSAFGFCFQTFQKRQLRLTYSNATLTIGFHPTQHTFLNKILFDWTVPSGLCVAVPVLDHRICLLWIQSTPENHGNKITTTADFDMSMVSGFGVTCFFLFFGTGRFFLKLQALCLVCRGGVSVKKQRSGIRVIIQGCYHPCYPYIQQQHDPTTSSWCTKQPFCYCTKHYYCSVFGNTPTLGTSLYTIIEGLTIKAWNHSNCKAQALQGLRQANRFVELRGVGQHREKVISCMFRLEVGKSNKIPHEKWWYLVLGVETEQVSIHSRGCYILLLLNTLRL